MTKYQKRCEDCVNCEIKKGIWTCAECFGQKIEDIDDCPEGITLEEVEEAREKGITPPNAKNLDKAKKERKPRPLDEDKLSLIQLLAENLTDKVENLEIVNKTKVITFHFNENTYKLDLIKQRPPKK